MIIQTSSVGTSASRQYRSHQTNYSEYSEWDNSTGSYFQEICSNALQVKEESYSQNGATSYETADTKETTEENVPTSPSDLEILMQRMGAYKPNGVLSLQERFEMVQDVKQKCLDYLLRILFGDTEKYVKDPNKTDRISSPGEESASNPVTQQAAALGQHMGTGWSHYSFYYHAESETSCFDTTGTAITADGRELNFNISLQMSRSFVAMAEERIDFGQPRFCDPLVINLGANVASISDQKFFFDLNADGTKEEISMLESSSGYLALDHNGDSIINDGSELFGTQSGNGFQDLIVHDKDGNGWIDEADSIFQKLKIWTMDENGNSTLMDLKEAGVGAIYLGFEDTEFALKNNANKTNALIQKTGIFLYENGQSGTIQQMDLAV